MPITVLNHEEAINYQKTISNSVTRELVGLVFGTLVNKWLKGDRPIESFDALFFVKILEDAFSSHEVIADLLRGGTIMWPET